jgi:hypothetical protein
MANVTIDYQPRNWQIEQHQGLKRFTTLVVHRRAGKTVFAVNELIKRAVTVAEKRPQVAYIAPSYSQAKKVSWEIFKQFALQIPGTKVNESELRIDFPNGGRILVLGAENPDSLRGLYLDYAVLDEVADMPQNLWDAVIRPALSDRLGGALFIGTPKGRNFFHNLYLRGKSDDPDYNDWKSTLLTYEETGALDPNEIVAIKKDLKNTPEVFEQEYNCSFTAAIKGAYFGKHMSRAEDDGRVTKIVYDEDQPVVAGWDIGLDGTGIWYAQVIAQEVRIIDFDFFEEKDIREILNVVLNKPYMYEVQYLPHDAVKRQMTNRNKSIEGTIKKAGLRTKVVTRLPILDRISIARDFINKCIFSTKCNKSAGKDVFVGLESLRQYRAKFDETKGLLQQEPLHDIHSHPADAFCYLAVGLKGQKSNRHGNYVQDRIRSGQAFSGKKNKSNWKLF